MTYRHLWVASAAAGLVAVMAAGAALSAPPASVSAPRGLAMLGGLAKGEWTITHRDGSPDLKICVRTGQELIQLRHPETGCSQFVIEDAEAKVTVQYKCPASNGYGRTYIRRENTSLVQIESQGFAGGLPFQFTAEARRTGRC